MFRTIEENLVQTQARRAQFLGSSWSLKKMLNTTSSGTKEKADSAMDFSRSLSISSPRPLILMAALLIQIFSTSPTNPQINHLPLFLNKRSLGFLLHLIMDNCLSNQAALPSFPSRSWRQSGDRGGGFVFPVRRKIQYNSMIVVAAAGPSRCEPGSSLNAPLEPRSAQGRFLRSVLLNKRQLFHYAAADELKQLADDRDAALARMDLSFGSDEASLHRRIAQLKERYCKTAVQDIIYMLIFYKYSEIRVPLVPKLSRCTYHGRLEIWPSKDWELESVHSCDALELIKEHVSTVIGLRVNSSVTDNWTTTQIPKLHLGKVYAASIFYGYFLKSASLRHQLECSLSDLKTPFFGTAPISNKQKLRHYISEFDPETLQRCAKPRTEEARNLIEKQSLALFGTEKSDETIVTSFSSLKRLVLEAVAFGTFLWDTELYVDGAYKLKENGNAEEQEEENRSV